MIINSKGSFLKNCNIQYNCPFFYFLILLLLLGCTLYIICTYIYIYVCVYFFYIIVVKGLYPLNKFKFKLNLTFCKLQLS